MWASLGTCTMLKGATQTPRSGIHSTHCCYQPLLQLQQFLGLVPYSGFYIPSFSTQTAPFEGLLWLDHECFWDSAMDCIFTTLKTLVCTDPMLDQFDVLKPVMMNADTFKEDTVSLLVQDSAPVALAAKGPPGTEQHNQSIDSTEWCHSPYKNDKGTQNGIPGCLLDDFQHDMYWLKWSSIAGLNP